MNDTPQTISERITAAMANPLTSDDIIDPSAELQEVLNGVGLDMTDAGGKVEFEGKDPILTSPWPLATMAGVSLMAKAVAFAGIWKTRTGESQDLSVDLRQVPHRLCPFYDRKWELLNGNPPAIPPELATTPFFPSLMYRTRDERWIQLLNMYPTTMSQALAILGCDNSKDAVAAVVRKYDGLELEEKLNAAGLQATLIRTVEEFMATEQYGYLKDMPLVEIEKIADSAPIPYTADPKTPLDGIRALGLGKVIAGAGFGRALALHGADVLNVWKPNDYEADLIYYTANVGMRSTTLDLKQAGPMARFKELLKQADIFFANRRPGFLGRYGLTAEQLAEIRPGLIHVDMSLYGWKGPWADRIGFDQNAGGVSGVFTCEGTASQPQLTEIFVVNDYAMAWIASAATAAALQRRAKEGGSYRIRISLARLSMWLLHMGIFDKSYTTQVGGTEGDHAYLAPELFEAETPCGHYQGVTDQVHMSRTPGGYATPLVPRGSSKAEWLPRG